MAVRPPEPCLVHRLPPAPHFVGREAELAELCRLWQTDFRGVLALAASAVRARRRWPPALTLARRRRLGHPGADATERLLAHLPG